MKIKFYTFLMSIFLLFSCKIKIDGIKSNYTKSKSENEALFVGKEKYKSVCEISNNNNMYIYITDGIMLNECLKTKEETIVYIWEPKCKSKICYPLNHIESKCNEKKIELFVVAEYYDTKLMIAENNIKSPILAIDTKYYRTNITSKYVSKFIYDLTSENKRNGRYLKFKKGKFINSFKDLNSAIN